MVSSVEETIVKTEMFQEVLVLFFLVFILKSIWKIIQNMKFTF